MRRSTGHMKSTRTVFYRLELVCSGAFCGARPRLFASGNASPFDSLLPPHDIACRLTACPGCSVDSIVTAKSP